jgi:hypothetical protein
MLYSELIAVCSDIDTERINTLCGQNVEVLNVKPCSACTHYRALENWLNHELMLRSNVVRTSILNASLCSLSRGANPWPCVLF